MKVQVSIPLVVGNKGTVVGSIFRRPNGQHLEDVATLFDDLTEEEYLAGGRRVEVKVELDLEALFPALSLIGAANAVSV